jgi:hypothetical protein
MSLEDISLYVLCRSDHLQDLSCVGMIANQGFSFDVSHILADQPGLVIP